MFRFAYNSDQATVSEIQLFRGSDQEVRDSGFTQEEVAYPHIYGDYLIESPTKFRKRE